MKLALDLPPKTSAPPRAAPFRIDVDPRILDDLQARLERTRWTEMPEESGWAHGTNRPYLRALLDYWRSGYDWRTHEARLNELAQFKGRVDDSDIHFIHEKGRGASPMPLLLLHGWPDSFYRFDRVIPKFTHASGEGRDPGDAFDVVVPSLPGFAFTAPLTRGDQPSRRTAQVLWRLMTEVLGYPRFAVAGGDGGSPLAQLIAIDHPESVIGVHLTDIGWHATQVDPASVSRVERKYLEASKKRFMADGAYVMVQTTRPLSLAPGLRDSPVGLASWIVDRFHSWSDGELESRFTNDDLLTNIMLYWVTDTIGSSILNYYADARSPSLTPADRVERPVGMALFPKDIGGIPPRSFAERTLNVTRWTEMPRGGHFAALEEPELYANDVIEFFRPLRALES